LCEEVPRQNAAESRKIPESGPVIPREGVERIGDLMKSSTVKSSRDPERGIESGERLKIER
jgi:hypothetical protein